MIDLRSIFTAAQPGMDVASTLFSAFGQNNQGNALLIRGQQENQVAKFQAEQLRQNAGQAQAVSQVQAGDVQRQADYVMSRALAVAAASGGGASDPTVINTIANIAGETAYRKAVALYGGNEKARQLNLQAKATEYTGTLSEQNAEQIKSASDLKVGTTLLKGGTSLYSKYAGGGPKAIDSNNSVSPASSLDNWDLQGAF